MEQNIIIPNTNISVSRLGFGTSSLHHLFSTTNRLAILNKASNAGITHFDTSPYYGYGLAERDLGKFLKGKRSSFTITTKVGLYTLGPESIHSSSVWLRKGLGKLLPNFSKPYVNMSVKYARKSLLNSLRSLNTEYVDFIFLHEPQLSLLNTDEMLDWMKTECKTGTVRAWGVSGLSHRIIPFINVNHQIASTVQTLDSNDLKQAEFILEARRPLQFTYGYLAGSRNRSVIFNPLSELSNAMTRNSTGCILVSARSEKHINEISTLLR
jgi:D-threo-aldose 1-dehydrogenase